MKTAMTIVMTLALAAICGCESSSPRSSSSIQPAHQADFVGPGGPDGPAGARGAQGAIGQTGAPGYAASGARGAEGPAGATGEQGRAGARGPAGAFVVGPAGVTGPAGNTGDQGRIGQTGVRGASADGYAGLAGPAGRTGAQGPTGDTGAKGPTLVGPAGPAGRSGPSGEQGEPGLTGAQGSTTAGVAGATGAAGAMGPQGPAGPTGPQGPAGVVDRWTSYREFWFDLDEAVVYGGDSDKVAEIAAYMKDNPSLQLGIDGSTNPRATEWRDRDLGDRRVKAIRDSLIAAGVPASRISDGMFGDVQLRRDRRVEVLIRTDQASRAQFGPAGVVERWTPYREFWFDLDEAVIHSADSDKVAEISAYMKDNPSLQLGIDGSTNPRATEWRDRDLGDRRVKAVRDSLIAAGVPASRISDGMFGDVQLRRDQRVEVLIKTETQLAKSQ